MFLKFSNLPIFSINIICRQIQNIHFAQAKKRNERERERERAEKYATELVAKTKRWPDVIELVAIPEQFVTQ